MHGLDGIIPQRGTLCLPGLPGTLPGAPAWEAWEAQGQRNAEHPNQLEPALSLLEKQQLFKWYLLLAQFFNKDTVF